MTEFAQILASIACIVAAAYWSVAASNFTNIFAKLIAKLMAVGMMLAGAVQLSLAINAYV